MNIMKNRKEDVIFVAVLLVLVLIFIVFRVVKGKKVEAPAVADVMPITTISGDQTAPRVIVKKKKTDTIWPELSYTETFTKYQNGNLLQFSQNCQARPVSMALKNGSDLMLDNRENKEEVITFGNTKYTLPAYGYEVINLSVKNVPVTFQVDCSTAQNVATIVME